MVTSQSREMKKCLLHICTLLLLCLSSFHSLAGDTIPAARSNVDYIDPTIGNMGQLLEPTRPTAQLPHQLIRVTPQRKDYMDDQISSFPLTIVSHRLGQVFALKPSAHGTGATAWETPLTYDHDLEINRPWYYSTWLIDDEVSVEFAPGNKSGCYRFNFPAGGDNALLFDVYNDADPGWNFTSDRELSGTEIYHGDIKVYMYGVFSVTGITGTKEKTAFIRFPSAARSVEFRYAISYISLAQAEKTFDKEIRRKSFDQVISAGKKIWSETMSKIKVEGGSLAQRRAFYTALYRCNERMVDITEDSSYYSGFDKQVHKDTRPFYVDDWSWDTYLALHPLRTILDPVGEEDMLQSYVRMYEQGGWMPTFPVLFGDHACMNGFHSSVTFLDAYRKGLRHFDIDKAYEGMRKNATDATLLPWRNGEKTSLDDFYHTKGYFPALHPGEKEWVPEVDPFEKRQAVAVTLGASYDDWALSQLAGELGKTADSDTFARRSQNYRNLWDPQRQLFMPRDSAGNWIDMDPKFDGGPGGRDYYDEDNGWTYKWQVQEDIPGLIGLMGGKAAFENRLDQLFREDLGRGRHEFWYKFPDATGLTGEYSMGNEPSFHIPYLYNFTASPWKTQSRIRFLLDTWFRDNVFSIPGDEDGGGMSAFVVFSSMGFYPLTPGSPVYTIGSPIFSRVTIDLPGGRHFSVIAQHASGINKFIQRASFNGKILNKPWFTHQQLIEGGTLELIMGPKPNKSWGTEKQAVKNYRFDSTISRPVLENYLSRAISVEGLLNGRGDLYDNIRMLNNTGAKFIGRSICLWGREDSLLSNFERARRQVPGVLKDDPDRILEACIFEIVTSRVDRVPVPDWAFKAMGMPVEKRNFRYEDMLYTDGRRRDQWGKGASVPDVSRLETRLWFYFLAASYIDLGFEAIHYGQVELMNGNDRDLAWWASVFAKARAYAAQHARRHILLCDAHVPGGGLMRGDSLMLDFHAFPLRIKEVPERPEEAILQLGFSDGLYRRSKGGITPSGWRCDHLPYLVELDNYGVSDHPSQPEQSKDGFVWIWGYDEISWFAHQPKVYRDRWLRYAQDWVRKTDPNGHLQMPGSRTRRSPLDKRNWYFANIPSVATPDGLGDEDTIREIWSPDDVDTGK